MPGIVVPRSEEMDRLDVGRSAKSEVELNGSHYADGMRKKKLKCDISRQRVDEMMIRGCSLREELKVEGVES